MAQSILQALKQPVTLRTGLNAVWAWWSRHAAIALDAATPRVFKERLLCIDVVADGNQLCIGDEGHARTVAASDPEALQNSVADTLGEHPAWRTADRVTGRLHLLPPDILRKRIALPIAAKSNLMAAVGYQIDIELPFRGADVYYGIRILAESATSVALEISVALRSRVDMLISAIEVAGLAVGNVYACSSRTESDPILLLPRSPEPPAKSRRQLWAISGLTAALAIAAVTAPLADKALEAERLKVLAERDVQLAAPVIATQRKLSKTLEARAQLARVVQRFPDPVQVLSALTASIPEDTWLTRLAMRDGEIQISGLTPSTSALIDELARTDMFYPPAYAAPAIQDPQFNRERFVLNIRLRPGL
jgi:general secretion pathway protein L